MNERHAHGEVWIEKRGDAWFYAWALDADGGRRLTGPFESETAALWDARAVGYDVGSAQLLGGHEGKPRA